MYYTAFVFGRFDARQFSNDLKLLIMLNGKRGGMLRSLFVVLLIILTSSGSIAQAESVNLSEDELLQICESKDQKIQFGGKMFVMGVLEVAKSKVVPSRMRLCPKGAKKSSDYFDQACDWIAADQNRHTRSAMLAVIASAASEACPVEPEPEAQ